MTTAKRTLPTEWRNDHKDPTPLRPVTQDSHIQSLIIRAFAFNLSSIKRFVFQWLTVCSGVFFRPHQTVSMYSLHFWQGTPAPQIALCAWPLPHLHTGAGEPAAPPPAGTPHSAHCLPGSCHCASAQRQGLPAMSRTSVASPVPTTRAWGWREGHGKAAPIATRARALGPGGVAHHPHRRK